MARQSNEKPIVELGKLMSDPIEQGWDFTKSVILVSGFNLRVENVGDLVFSQGKYFAELDDVALRVVGDEVIWDQMK